MFELFDIQRENGDDSEIADLMQEIYLHYFTKSMQPYFEAKPEERESIPPTLYKRREVELKEHNSILEKIITSRDPMPALEKDPLLSKEVDLAMDLRGFDGYTLKSSSTFVSRDKDRVQVSKGA